MPPDETSCYQNLQLRPDELKLLSVAFEYYVRHEGDAVTNKEVIEMWLDLYDYIKDAIKDAAIEEAEHAKEQAIEDAALDRMCNEVDDNLSLSGEALERAKKEGMWP